MTRDEASKILNDYDINFDGHTAEEIAEAHEMAIEALREHQHYKDLAESYEKTTNKLTEAIAEQQPKTGHWIKHKHNGKPYFNCSECSYFVSIGYNYCPGCGARMEANK